MIAVLYVAAVTAWAAVIAYMAPAVWSIYVRQTRKGDPARAICLLYAALMCGFLARRIAFEGMAGGWAVGALLAASTGVAVLTLRVAYGYGRGSRV